MRYSKLFPAASFLMGLAFNLAIAQNSSTPVQGPEAPPTPPTFEIDKTGARAHINFNLSPTAVSVPGMKLSGFANRKLMIFYFSSDCPHCQHAAPYVQKLADELAPKGFQSIAISIQSNAPKSIAKFIQSYNVHMPIFQDSDRTFGEGFGTGSIPLLFLVNEKGEYIRYKTFNAEQTPMQMKAEAASVEMASAKTAKP